MIPLIDDYLQMYIVNGLKFLKKHPSLIDRIFYTGKRDTLQSLKDFITKKPIKVVIGYPKDQTSLPCYVITLAPESEVPLGLGDGAEEYYNYEGEIDEDSSSEEYFINKLSEYLNATYMNSNYRIECWSDNGDLTSYMYIILKWCLWTSRSQMLKDGWVNISVSGTDLEPVPDYMPIFIYRRSVQLNLQYENLYYSDTKIIDKYLDIIENGNNKYEIKTDDNGDKKVIDKDTGETVYDEADTYIIRPHYYSETIWPNYK